MKTIYTVWTKELDFRGSGKWEIKDLYDTPKEARASACESNKDRNTQVKITKSKELPLNKEDDE